MYNQLKLSFIIYHECLGGFQPVSMLRPTLCALPQGGSVKKEVRDIFLPFGQSNVSRLPMLLSREREQNQVHSIHITVFHYTWHYIHDVYTIYMYMLYVETLYMAVIPGQQALLEIKAASCSEYISGCRKAQQAARDEHNAYALGNSRGLYACLRHNPLWSSPWDCAFLAHLQCKSESFKRLSGPKQDVPKLWYMNRTLAGGLWTAGWSCGPGSPPGFHLLTANKRQLKIHWFPNITLPLL